VLLQHVRRVPPPLTNPTPRLFTLAGRDAGGEYRVPVEILRDGSAVVAVADPIPPPDAEHRVTMQTFGRHPGPRQGSTVIVSESTGGRFTHSGGKVVGVSQWPRVLKVAIRIEYGLGARSDQTVGYGRGTTDDDIRAERTTLGWHEHCHREAYIAFLRRERLPQFSGNVGQSVQAYQNHGTAYEKAVKAYFDRAEKESGRLVDEVGYRRSEYLANHP
jgi:hypothetical protein